MFVLVLLFSKVTAPVPAPAKERSWIVVAPVGAKPDARISITAAAVPA